MGSTRAATAAGRRGAAARAGGTRATPKARTKPASRPRAASKPRATSKPARRASTTRSKAGVRRKGAATVKSSSRRPRKRGSKPSAARASASRRARSSGARLRFGWRARVAVLLVLAIGGAGGYLFWLRDSSLVAVTDVEIVGVRSGDRERIVAELTGAAEGMTTLHVDGDQLDRVGARFATVASLSADANFPHGLRIEVVERPPALVATRGGEQAAVAADGSVLSGLEAPEGLPRVEVAQLPGAGRLEGADLEQALVAGAAPGPLAPLIEGVAETREAGVEVTLRGGIPVRFGDASRIEDKWAAAAAALADPKLTALAYLDVRAPERPTRGGA